MGTYQRLKKFLYKYGNSDFFIEKNMCLCTQPHLQKRNHLAGYVGFENGEFYFYLLPKAMNAVLTPEELQLFLETAYIEFRDVDIFDTMRKVNLYAIKAKDYGITIPFFDPHNDYRRFKEPGFSNVVFIPTKYHYAGKS